tara:strand:- start:219 stop:386 length:168 start_codon:yes stop_codon:yes gene_type:complete
MLGVRLRVVAEDSRKIHAIRCQDVRTLSMEGMVWASVRYQAMARTEFLRMRLRPA